MHQRVCPWARNFGTVTLEAEIMGDAMVGGLQGGGVKTSGALVVGGLRAAALLGTG